MINQINCIYYQVFIMLFLCILMLKKVNNTEPHREFNLSHFILHVTTTDGK